MTTTYANLAWPADPFRTGQQLFRKPGPMLTAFTLTPDPGDEAGQLSMVVAAMVYLPLHRTRTVMITSREMPVGFRAVSTSDHSELPALARIADLDLARAVRHGSVMAGHLLAAELARLQELAGGAVLRGVTSTARAWTDRDASVQGRAIQIDTGLDLPAASLDQACQIARIGNRTSWEQIAHGTRADSELATAQTVGRCLTIALLAGRHLGRVCWQQDLNVTEAVTASAWDCFPQLRARQCSKAVAESAGVSPGGTGAA